jgi:hypothetical protein
MVSATKKNSEAELTKEIKEIANSWESRKKDLTHAEALLYIMRLCEEKGWVDMENSQKLNVVIWRICRDTLTAK